MSFIKRYYKKYWDKEPQTVFDIFAYKTVCRIISLLYFLKYITVLRNTEKELSVRAKYNSTNKRSVFVFANGPSLGDIDFEKVSKLQKTGDYDVIAVNSFLSKSGTVLQPNYAVFADAIHFGIKIDESSESAQYKEDIAYCHEHNIITLIPAEFYKKTNIKNKFAFCTIASIYDKNIKNICRPVGFFRLTALFALALANQLKYDNIYICGFDNSYFKDFEVDEGGGLKLKHYHYYNDFNDNVDVTPLADSTTSIFFDFYRHFHYIEKITKGSPNFYNVAKKTYLSFINKNNSLDIYK